MTAQAGSTAGWSPGDTAARRLAEVGFRGESRQQRSKCGTKPRSQEAEAETGAARPAVEEKWSPPWEGGGLLEGKL